MVQIHNKKKKKKNKMYIRLNKRLRVQFSLTQKTNWCFDLIIKSYHQE